MIDRPSVVARHSPIVRTVDPTTVLTVGNGQLAFNPDVTGFQSLNESYGTPFPLVTLTDWMWHSSPFPENVDAFKDFKYSYLPSSRGSSVPYPLLDESPAAVTDWLRANPHRLDVGQVALRVVSPGGGTRALRKDDLSAVQQELALWSGELSSSFSLLGGGVRVSTTCHPELDVVGWQLSLSDQLDARLAVRLAFPYGSSDFMSAADWNADPAGRNHTTAVVEATSGSLRLKRQLDYDEYEVRCEWSGGMEAERDGPHALLLALPAGLRSLDLRCLFAPPGGRYPLAAEAAWQASKSDATRRGLEQGLPSAAEVRSASAAGWASFWRSGAFVELGGGASPDPRAAELERRLILSQYLTRVHSAGALPPQETGLAANSWFGKHHHEMRFWHQAHFPLWGRAELLARSDGWFAHTLANATSFAAFQGYRGARWPKMVGPVTNPLSPLSGRSVGNASAASAHALAVWDSPSGVGPLLIWEQPHVIWMAEAQRLAASSGAEEREVMRRLWPLVEATADFMASYASPPTAEAAQGELWLGPPVVGGEESGNNDAEAVYNPTFSLTYWKLGLAIAAQWATALGRKPHPEWARVAAALPASPATAAVDGEEVYTFNGNCSSGFGEHGPALNCPAAGSHMMMLAPLGMIGGAAYGIDPRVMNATIRAVIKHWKWGNSTTSGLWGWDFPLTALAMIRIKLPPTDVVDMLLKDVRANHYRASGHLDGGFLPCYLPGNGGLLAAVAMMAGGARGSPNPRGRPWFPEGWTVRAEGFEEYP